MLKKLVVENFKGFNEKKEVKFDNGFNLILGKNATGKSSILYGIKFALFGNYSKQGSKNGVNNPNYDQKKNAIAELDFVGNNGKHYQVSFTYKPRGRENGSELYVYEDNKFKQVRDVSLKEVFPFHLDLFNEVFFIEEGELYNFLKIRGDVWKKVSSYLSELLKLNELDKLMNFFNNMSKKYDQERKRLASRMEELSQQNIEEKLKSKKQELEEIDVKIKNLESLGLDDSTFKKWKEINDKKTRLEERINIKSEEIKKLRQKLKNKSLPEIESIIEKKKKEIIELEREHREKASILEKNKEELHFYEGTVKSLELILKEKQNKCPTCLRPLTVEETKKSLEFARKKLITLKANVEFSEKNQHKTLKIMNKTKEEKEELERVFEKLTKDLEELKRLNNDLEKIKEQLSQFPNMDEISENINELTKLRISKQNLMEEKQQLEKIKEEFETLPDKINRLNIRRIFTSTLSDIIKETRDYRLHQSLEPLQKNLRKLIRELKGDNWDIIFDKAIEPVIIKMGSGQTHISFDDLSGAEKTMVFLMFRWLLSEQITGKPFLIMDDALNHLDTENKKRFLELLKELLKNKEKDDFQLIIASYDYSIKESLLDISPNIIEV